jgi:hypothetical protein
MEEEIPRNRMSVIFEDELPDGVELGAFERFKYGVIWSCMKDTHGRDVAQAMPDWMIEREMLACPDDRKPSGFRGKAFHMREFITLVWGARNDLFFIEWNPNALKILDRYCKNKITAVAGHASSGKSYIFAAIAVTEFLINPVKTKVLVTSHTKQSAQGKIWGDIQNCWTVADVYFKGMLPGRLLLGKSIIRYQVGKIINPKAGIELLAGEANEVKESTKKIQGYKSDTIIVIGDEWATMPIAIYNDVLSNLRANPNSRLLCGFNPDTFHDPGGLVSKPVGGWHKVNVDSEEWSTQIGGYCIHFDAEKSPNVLDIKAEWRGLITHKMLSEMREVYPKGSKQDDQFVRGWWSQTGARPQIYSEADIEKYGADRKELRWVRPPVPVAGLDIGNDHGGDRTVLTIGVAGLARADNGEIHVVCERKETLILSEDTSLDDSLSEQIAKKVKYHLQEAEWGPETGMVGKRNVPTANLALDATGGGTHFAALLARDIGGGFILVGFGEKASDRRVARNDKRLGHEAFANRVSELWGVPVQLVRTGQIRGLDPDLVFELTVRTYKDDGAKRMQIESKEDMKSRTNGNSPDRADSWVLMIEAARERCALSSSEKAAQGVARPVDEAAFGRQVEEFFDGDSFAGAGVMPGCGWGDEN